uniref:Uncharacterized protein n=1 Tax=Megaselia scalaris TaxID=36166 RepID=T1H0C9_MEGSC
MSSNKKKKWFLEEEEQQQEEEGEKEKRRLSYKKTWFGVMCLLKHTWKKPSHITGGATKLKGSNSDIISPRQPLSQANTAISPAPASTVIPHQSPNAPGGVANTNTLILQQPLHQQTIVQSSQSLQQPHHQQLHHQQHPTQHITAQIHTMKDQPQQPMIL